jgi:hypothetical protein
MHKKLMMACMAIAAFAAFVVAPAASASPVLTSGGSAVATGTSITAKNTGNTTFTSSIFNVTCSSAHLVGTVTANAGTQIKGTIPKGSALYTGTGAGGDCTSGLGDVKVTVSTELCIETVKGTDTVIIDGCGANLGFTLAVTGGIACNFTGKITSGATFVTNAAATVNVVKGASVSSTDPFCPSSGTLDMDFDLYNTAGTQLTVS